jgi:hypothetical protein
MSFLQLCDREGALRPQVTHRRRPEECDLGSVPRSASPKLGSLGGCACSRMGRCLVGPASLGATSSWCGTRKVTLRRTQRSQSAVLPYGLLAMLAASLQHSVSFGLSPSEAVSRREPHRGGCACSRMGRCLVGPDLPRSNFLLVRHSKSDAQEDTALTERCAAL